jgi:four helix bundle protein
MSIVREFRELRVYARARAGCRRIFEVTMTFPREERYSMTDQIRRSSRAAKNILAEAWGRRRYRAAFINKIDEAMAEATETQGWLDDALDCGYITAEQHALMNEDWISVSAMFSRMIDRAADFCPNDPDTNYTLQESRPLDEFFVP